MFFYDSGTYYDYIECRKSVIDTYICHVEVYDIHLSGWWLFCCEIFFIVPAFYLMYHNQPTFFMETKT